MENASDRLYIYDTSVPAKQLNKVDALPKVMSIYKMAGRWNEPKVLIKTNDFISPGTAYELDLNDYSVKVLRHNDLPDKTFNSDDYA